MGAHYNSFERDVLDAPKCHPHTRVAVINRLIDWLTRKIDNEALIMWLYGAAGAGKSAIAHAIAEICDKSGWLLATFFFWKTAPERNNASRFVATVAYQVALAIPAACEFIEVAINCNHRIIDQSIDTQLSKLILEPLKRLHSTGFHFDNSPFVIIIDGLDECQGKDTQSRLVKSLATAFHCSPFRIRILVACRPEVYLQSSFNSSLVQPRLARLALSGEYSPDEDIYLFLKDSFDKIKQEHPLAFYLPSSWPPVDVLRELTHKSSGQFIFASTTVKYIGGDPHHLPHHRLDVIRRLRPPRGEEDLPYADLNSLYHHVLSNVEDVEAVKLVLGVLLFVESKGYTADKMDTFLCWQRGETKASLGPLASIITCNTTDHISILHASLSDFLLDPSRSHHFYLCREHVLGNCLALKLRQMQWQKFDGAGFFYFHSLCSSFFKSSSETIPDPWYLCLIRSINASPFCTSLLRQELSQLSFLTLYRVYGMCKTTYQFWLLMLKIAEMLCNQVSHDDLDCHEFLLMVSRILRRNSLISSPTLQMSAFKH